jgi:hypothetical protein
MVVFIAKGDSPMSEADLSAGTQRKIELDWPMWKRERAMRTDPAALNAYMDTVATDTDANRANNLFNQQLADFRAATIRLAKVQLSVGRAAYSEQIDTGQTVWDDDAQGMVPVMETIDHPVIDPLPATVDGWDNTDPENPVAAQVPNPLIVADNAERDAAQAVIDGTPTAVKKFT